MRMGGADTPRGGSAPSSDRLRLRGWRIDDATLLRRLWEERDERVPPRRRISADGHPTVEDLEGWVRRYEPTPLPGLAVVEEVTSGRSVGYCGLVENSVGHPGEPELAFEFLRASWGRGLATEASRIVIGRAATIGHTALMSTVRSWNTASVRVLAKLGFTDVGVGERDARHGSLLLFRLPLR